MKRFNEDFRTRLYETIKGIEDRSLVEIVVLIKPQSGSYKDIALWSGLVILIVFITFFMYSPILFANYLIYVFALFGFLTGYYVVDAIPALEAKLTPQKRKDKNVEIAARAIFQKAGIRLTSERIGILIYCSLQEQQVYILPDRGAKNAVPEEDWHKIKANFQSIFKNTDLPGALLKELNSCKPIFAEFIPPVENDINELPDNLDIDL